MADAKKPEEYMVNFSLTITERVDLYSSRDALKFNFSERLPDGKDAEKYIRQRLDEELKRNFGNLKSPLIIVPDADPLSAD